MINEGIRAKEVRVITADGEQLGIMHIKEALKIGQEKNLDVVCVAPTANPPVCRIMDYGKYRFEQSKREKEARKNQKIIEIKEMKFRPKIEEHDFNVKTKNVERFLKAGDKVKVTIMFRGREKDHPELGEQLLNKVVETIGDLATVEKRPKLEGRNMIMILAPKQ